MGVTPPPWTGPAVGLMDLDAFFASVEMLDHPNGAESRSSWAETPIPAALCPPVLTRHVALACTPPCPQPRHGACARKPFGRTGTLIATAR
mgnify:CR=1 FL=1